MPSKVLELPSLAEFKIWLLESDNIDRSLDDLANTTDNPLWWLYLVPDRPDDKSMLDALVSMGDHDTMKAVAGQVYSEIVVRTKLTTIFVIEKEEYRQMVINLVSEIISTIKEDDARLVNMKIYDGVADGNWSAKRSAEAKLSGVDNRDADSLLPDISSMIMGILRGLQHKQ